MVKSYFCPVHGEFEVECNIGDEELKSCPNAIASRPTINVNFEIQEYHKCNQPVTRVYKPTGYSFKCDGFAGKGFQI